MHITTWTHWFCDRCHGPYFGHFDLHFDDFNVVAIGFVIDFAFDSSLGFRERFFVAIELFNLGLRIYPRLNLTCLGCSGCSVAALRRLGL